MSMGGRQMIDANASKKPNAQVNRQKCEAFLSALNLQLGWGQMRGLMSYSWVCILMIKAWPLERPKRVDLTVTARTLQSS
jgi:hypothetical protein